MSTITADRQTVVTDSDRLIERIVKVKESARDFVADSNNGSVAFRTRVDPTPVLRLGEDYYPLTGFAHRQLATKLGIPWQYYERMLKDHPDLLVHNVQTWFYEEPKKMLFRTAEDHVRAVLSDKYHTLDNYDLIQAIAPVLQNMEVKEAAFTDRRLYIKAVFPGIQGEMVPGQVVNAGIIWSNSEVGAGSLSIERMVWECRCANGWIAGRSLRKYHVGRSSGNGNGDITELLSDDTKQLGDAAFWAEVSDVSKSVTSRTFFDQDLDTMRQANDCEIGARDLSKFIEVTGRKLDLSEQEQTDTLKALLKGATEQGNRLSKLGLGQALTNAAQHRPYDRRVELERSGFQLLKMASHDWINLNNEANSEN